MRMSCCLRQWISAPTARSTAAVGAAPLDIARTCTRAHTRTLAFACHPKVTVRTSFHWRDWNVFPTLKTHLLNLTSAQFGVLISIRKNKDWNIISVVSYHQKVCWQNSARADSFSLSFQCFCLILGNIFSPHSSSNEALSGAAPGFTVIIIRVQYLSIPPQHCDNVCAQRPVWTSRAHNGISIVKFTEGRCESVRLK